MNLVNQTFPKAAKQQKRRGNIVVIAVAMLVVVIGFMAFSIDYGYVVVAESDQQNAADSGALSGARALKNGRAAAITAAKTWANKHVVAGENVVVNDEAVEIGEWNDETATFTPLPANSPQSPDAVRVTCGHALKLFFAPVIGTDTADILVSATACVKPSRCGLFIGIDKVEISGGSYMDSYNSDTAPYNAATAGDEGHVCSDGEIKLSSSSYVNGNALPGDGFSVSMSGSSYVTGSTTPRSEPLDLPPVDFGNSASNNENDSIPTSDNGEEPYNSSTEEFKLSGGDHVALPPGTYYFSKFTLSGGSSITVTGPTVIYCVGDFTASGSSIANASQLPTNLQVFCTGSKVDISGGSDFYGVVYAPSSKVVRSSGSSNVYGSLIGKELTLSGGGGAHADTALGLLDGTSGNVTLVN
jgi:Flp pilus assembly protein TadG